VLEAERQLELEEQSREDYEEKLEDYNSYYETYEVDFAAAAGDAAL
jgi:hypothetical protein